MRPIIMAVALLVAASAAAVERHCIQAHECGSIPICSIVTHGRFPDGGGWTRVTPDPASYIPTVYCQLDQSALYLDLPDGGLRLAPPPPIAPPDECWTWDDGGKSCHQVSWERYNRGIWPEDPIWTPNR